MFKSTFYKRNCGNHIRGTLKPLSARDCLKHLFLLPIQDILALETSWRPLWEFLGSLAVHEPQFTYHWQNSTQILEFKNMQIYIKKPHAVIPISTFQHFHRREKSWSTV